MLSSNRPLFQLFLISSSSFTCRSLKCKLGHHRYSFRFFTTISKLKKMHIIFFVIQFVLDFHAFIASQKSDAFRENVCYTSAKLDSKKQLHILTFLNSSTTAWWVLFLSIRKLGNSLWSPEMRTNFVVLVRVFLTGSSFVWSNWLSTLEVAVFQ